MTLADLRRLAVARSLFPPTTLERAHRTSRCAIASPATAPGRKKVQAMLAFVRERGAELGGARQICEMRSCGRRPGG